MKQCPVVLQTGFRIFFLGAAAYAVVSMAVWYFFYVAGANIFVVMPLTVWHGHEMIFGFTMAVVAGFLLTAVINWTGHSTLSGWPLLMLFVLWIIGRVLAFLPSQVPSGYLMAFNLLFLALLCYGVMRPIIVSKQKGQSAVFSKLLLMLAAAGIFYWALSQQNLWIERKSLRFSVYLIISLILTIARRVMPFFIERGVGYPVNVPNSRWVDISSMMALVAFCILDIFWPQPVVIAMLSLFLAVVHAARLMAWHTPGVWKKPLLWVLFAGYMFVILGFVLKSVAVLNHQPDDAALHAWTAGGIGIFTLGMMARVAWGHTGRNIAQPPPSVGAMFLLVIAGAVLRVLGPLVGGQDYLRWIAAGQLFWIAAFLGYLVVYFQALVSVRPDGRWG